MRKKEVLVGLVAWFILLLIILGVMFLPAESQVYNNHQMTEFEGGYNDEMFDWRARYNGRGNVSCCGIKDCTVVNSRLRVVQFNWTSTTHMVELDGIQFEVENKSVHLSEDENTWYCGRQLFHDWKAKCHGTKWLTDPQTCYQCLFISSRI